MWWVQLPLNEYLAKATKSVGVISALICANYCLRSTLGLDSEFLQHAWGILCLLIFVEGMILHNDLKLLQERFDDLVKRYGFMQDLYHDEKAKSQQVLDQKLRELEVGMSAIKSSLSELSDSIKSQSSPENGAMDININREEFFESPCSRITPMVNSEMPMPPLGTADYDEYQEDDSKFDYALVREGYRNQKKKSNSFHGTTAAMQSKTMSIEKGDHIKSLHFTVELQNRSRRTSSASTSSATSSKLSSDEE